MVDPFSPELPDPSCDPGPIGLPPPPPAKPDPLNCDVDLLSLSPVTVAELVHGIYRAKTPEAAQHRREYIEELVNLVPVHPATKQTAWLVGQLERQEAAKGNTLPFNDLLIAAAAIEQGYAVLTGNLRHSQKIPGLKVVAW